MASKLNINLSVGDKTILEENGINVARFAEDTVRYKLRNMVEVNKENMDDIAGRITKKILHPDLPELHSEILQALQNAGRLPFLDLGKGKFIHQDIESISELDFPTVTDDFIIILPQQEALLLCDMVDPEEWLNNAFRATIDKLLAGTFVSVEQKRETINRELPPE